MIPLAHSTSFGTRRGGREQAAGVPMSFTSLLLGASYLTSLSLRFLTCARGDQNSPDLTDVL